MYSKEINFDNLTVWPEELKDEFWQSISTNNISAKYLGAHAETMLPGNDSFPFMGNKIE